MQENDLKRENTKLKLEIIRLKDRIKGLNGEFPEHLGGFQSGTFWTILPVGIRKLRKIENENRILRAWFNRGIRNAQKQSDKL